MQNRLHKICLIALFTFIITFNLTSLWHNSTTYDESSHLMYGRSITLLDSTRLDNDDSKMPFSALNALVYLPNEAFGLRYTDSFKTFLVNPLNLGRSITVLFSLFVAFIIFKWTKELYGQQSALFAVFLYSFEPNILAHSQVITNDLYSIGMVTVSTYSFWLFLKSRTLRHGVLCSIFLGLSQLAKYTCIFLYPIFLIIAAISYYPVIVPALRQREINNVIRQYFVPFIKYACMYVVISVLIINMGYFCNNTLTPLNKYQFKSELFQKVQSKLALIGNTPIPLPYPYIQGLDLLILREHTEGGRGNVYLMGALHKKLQNLGGFKEYYLYICLFKVPIAILIIVALAFIRYASNFQLKNFLENELFLVVPLLIFTVYFNYFYNNQIGIRHFLVVFPFFIIFSASIIQNWNSFMNRSKAAFFLLSAWLILSVVSFFPHYIPYVNELVWNRKMAYKLFGDSNIDWGQSEWYLKKYLERNPQCIVNPNVPTAGRIIVNVNALLGITTMPEQYQWLRDNFEPVDHVAYSYLVFDVTNHEIEKLRRGERL